jgi:hypothetical protein
MRTEQGGKGGTPVLHRTSRTPLVLRLYSTVIRLYSTRTPEYWSLAFSPLGQRRVLFGKLPLYSVSSAIVFQILMSHIQDLKLMKNHNPQRTNRNLFSDAFDWHEKKTVSRYETSYIDFQLFLFFIICL